MERTCFFIGHRNTPDKVINALTDTVEKCITEHGAKNFVVGQYGNFDRLSADAVIAAKKRCSDISLLLLLPYHPAESKVEVPCGFDGTYYPEGMESVPKRLSIIRANHYMADHSDFLIAYVWRPASNARELLEYSKRRESRGLITVINLAESMEWH